MARLFLDSGQTFGTIGPFGTTEVIGTTGNETVSVEGDGKASFDPSFNRGGDHIVIEADAALFSGALSGSSLVITADNGANIRIPVGTAGATITFDDGSYQLLFTNNAVKLGDQTITGTATALAHLGTAQALSEVIHQDVVASNLLTLG